MPTTTTGVQQSPFRNCLDPQSFYQSPSHEEALARLHFLVGERRRLGLLMGPTGSGKSLVLEVFSQQLRRRGRPVAKVSLLGLEPSEMLWQIAAELGVVASPRESLAMLWRHLADRLLEYRYQQLETAILLDDADTAAAPSLLQIVRLAHHDPTPDARLTIVLAGRTERMGRLGSGLLGLAELRIDLEPWNPAETTRFVRSVLDRAQGDVPEFDELALVRLHELAGGIPRRVRQIADLALLAGAGRDLRNIDAHVVESAYEELAVMEV
jgi:type II secretory pathway predicted ATPase ExeA